MNDVLKAGVVALATARLTQLVASDEISKPVRTRVGAWADGAPEGSLKDRVNYLVNCPRCVSVWAATAMVVMESRPSTVTTGLVRLLAASQATMLMLKLEE